MSDRLTTRESGFSLMEMTISLALGAIVLAAAVQMYTKSVGATYMVSQRAEMQQDFRAASNMLTKDLSLAGSGLGNGVAIALAAGVVPQYGCDQSRTCYINGTFGTYPVQGGTYYLYGLLTGYNLGPTLNTTPTDVVTVVYTDSSFYLNCYIPTVSAAGKSVVFSQPSGASPWAGCLPNSSVTTPQAVNDSAAGLTPGDLVLMSLGGATIVAEVTGAVTTGTDGNGNTTYTVPFANSDPLKMNNTSSSGGLNGVAKNVAGAASGAPCGGSGPCRLLVITYYIDNTATPPRLMRQISGHTPMPVVENIAYLKFSYDLFNESTATPAIGCQNPGAVGDVCTAGSSSGLLPNQITKINVLNMAMDSSQRGAGFGLGKGYQSMDLQTSVCARNLTYNNNYPN